MECCEYLERISDLIDGELTPSEEQDIKSHLSICSQCSQFYQELQLLNMKIQEEINDIIIPNDLEGRVLKAVEKDREKMRQQNWMTIIILALLGSPILILFYPRVLTGVRLLYSFGNAAFRSLSTLLSFMSPIVTLSILCLLVVITWLSLMTVRSLLHELDTREVLS